MACLPKNNRSRHLFLVWGAAALIMMLGTMPAYGQVADTVSVSADSVRSVPVDPASPVGFPTFIRGSVVRNVLPALSPEQGISHYLSDATPGFLYDLGAPGWPHGLFSYYVPAEYSRLTLDGRPFSQLLSGRPLYELLPTELLDSPVSDPVGAAGTRHVFTTRNFSEKRPLTELRYVGGDDELQIISASHQQLRPKLWFNRPGHIQYLVGITGRASDGEYVNSDTEVRQILGRIRYQNTGWSLEIQNFHNRYTAGAHGGVVQVGDFNSVFDRGIRQVYNSSYRRETIRNDLAAVLRIPVLGGKTPPASVSGIWQIERFTSMLGTDTLQSVNDRLELHVRQEFFSGSGKNRMLIEVSTGLEKLPSGNASQPERRTWPLFSASADDSLLLGRLGIRTRAGLSRSFGNWYPEGAVAVSGTGTRRLYGQFTSVPVFDTWISRWGWGQLVTPDVSQTTPRLSRMETGIHLDRQNLAIRFNLFGQRTSDMRLLLQTEQRDSVSFATSPFPVDMAGASVRANWRAETREGFFGSVLVSTQLLKTDDRSHLASRLDRLAPLLHGEAVAGVRYLLFEDDLDLTAKIRGRFWTSVRSPTFFGPTGQFAIPLASNESYGPSGVVDVVVEGVIRGATTFITFENLFAGWAYAGSLIVPVYPLPETRLRFGVHWPIWN